MMVCCIAWLRRIETGTKGHSDAKLVSIAIAISVPDFVLY
jgi:hypothetical protein